MKSFYDYKIRVGMSDNTLLKSIKKMLMEEFPTIEFRMFPVSFSGSYTYQVMFDTHDTDPEGIVEKICKAIHDKGPWKNLDCRKNGVDYRNDVTYLRTISVQHNSIPDEEFSLLTNSDLFSESDS